MVSFSFLGKSSCKSFDTQNGGLLSCYDDRWKDILKWVRFNFPLHVPDAFVRTVWTWWSDRTTTTKSHLYRSGRATSVWRAPVITGVSTCWRSGQTGRAPSSSCSLRTEVHRNTWVRVLVPWVAWFVDYSLSVVRYFFRLSRVLWNDLRNVLNCMISEVVLSTLICKFMCFISLNINHQLALCRTATKHFMASWKSVFLESFALLRESGVQCYQYNWSDGHFPPCSWRNCLRLNAARPTSSSSSPPGGAETNSSSFSFWRDRHRVGRTQAARTWGGRGRQ